MPYVGGCLCGAVRFSAELEHAQTGACHCETCLKWAGGPFFAVATQSVTFESSEHLKTFTSSPWAERGFCDVCGSSMFYRLTIEGPKKGMTNLALGTFDDRAAFELGYELFVDNRAPACTLMGEHKQMTGDEVMGRAKSS